MRALSKKQIAVIVALSVLVVPLSYFYGSAFTFWKLTVLTILTLVCWTLLALLQSISKARFGKPRTLEEILREPESIGMVQQLRYHLGWNPEKIAAELNRRGIQYQGRPWQGDEIRQMVRGIARPWK